MDIFEQLVSAVERCLLDTPNVDKCVCREKAKAVVNEYSLKLLKDLKLKFQDTNFTLDDIESFLDSQISSLKEQIERTS